MSIKTGYKRVHGLGSAKSGVEHWWAQRVTSIALLLLSPFFVIPFALALGAPHAEVVAIYSNPFAAIGTVLFLATAFYHLKLGLQVIIEDYVHAPAARTFALLANTLLCALFGVAAVLSVIRLFVAG